MSGTLRGFVIGIAVSAMIVHASDVFGQELLSVGIEPVQNTFVSPLERAQLVVTQHLGKGRAVDLTRRVTIVSGDEAIVAVDERGRVRPVGDGETTITVGAGEITLAVPVSVVGVADPQPVGFGRHVVPVLTKAGCNQGACHASQFGKGNLKLSLLGYAPEEDHPQFVRDWMQRRVSLLVPEESLILRKATGSVSHGGGQRFEAGSIEYDTLLQWLRDGAPAPPADEPLVVALSVTPKERVYAEGDGQQLRVVAEYSDGTSRDVTHLALYDSLGEGVATVDGSGLVSIVGPGQAAVMVRFQGQAKVSMALVPFHETETSSSALARFEPRNSVDEAIRAHWRRLNVQPSELCSDAEFVRRAFLDAIGTLPSREKVEAFLRSDAADKHEQLVDELLGLTGDPARDVYTSEWSAYWALKWGDLLRNNRTKVGDGGMWAFHNWVREALRENRPVDEFVREIITAQGSIFANGPANYFKIASNPEDLAETTVQVFLGVRLQCAKCHHHPFESYSQADYYGLAAFFTRVGTKASEDFGALGRDTVVLVKNSGSIKHPRTGKPLPPTPLGGEPVPLDGVGDLRRPLAQWLTAPDNELFSRNIVNRFWGYFLGSGLVEPIDDMRHTNPASVPALLDALADDFTASRFDLKHLMRTIMTSRVYQLSSVPRPENRALDRLFLHYHVKRLPAEVLLDAIDDACGTQERFRGVPLGTRAIELPDTNFASYFLDTMGRPLRTIACECERTSEPNLAQVLHVANGDVIQNKLSDKQGRIAGLVTAGADDETAIRELYFATFSRPPSDEELSLSRSVVAGTDDRQQAVEDLLWALLNSREFLFNH
ncbi:MAG: DUF1549 domain-containing protein [Planctomycetaceae bacterium]